MRNFLFFIFIFFPYFVFSQQIKIQGKIIDKKTKKALPFANVYLNKNIGTTADFNGEFQILVPEEQDYLTISYIGYAAYKLQLKKGKKFYKIGLLPENENLEEVILTAKVENPAIKIIKNLISHKKQNNYKTRINKIFYDSYYKFLVSANREEMNCNPDTIKFLKEGKVFTRIDSTMYKNCLELQDKDIYLMENITRNTFKNNKIHHKIIAHRMAGFKTPLYELLQIQFNDIDLYSDFYSFAFQKYLSPVSKLSIKKYHYQLSDTLTIQNRKVYKIDYKNTQKPLITGSIFVDAKNYAIAHLTLNSFNNIEFKSNNTFRYFPKYDLWFPSTSQTFIKKAKGEKNIKYGEILEIRNETDTLHIHSNPQNMEDVTYIQISRKNTNIHFDSIPKNFISNFNLEISPKALNQPESFWKKYRTIKPSEIKTYQYIDSISKAEKIEPKINKFRYLSNGFIPTKWINWDFLNLLDYNQYENIRLQIGGKTSTNFSDKFIIKFYGAYGFKDKTLKYHLGFYTLLNRNYQSFIGLSYTNDLNKDANFEVFQTPYAQPLFKNHIAYKNYTLNSKFSLNFYTLLRSDLVLDLNLYHSKNIRKYNTPFHYGPVEFPKYDLTGIDAQFVWEPRSEFMLSDFGRKKIKDKFPKFLLKIQGNIPELQIDKSQFIRGSFQAIFRKNYLNLDYTDIAINLGGSILSPRLGQLYQPDFNDYSGGYFWKHININDAYRFETVKDLEFANNFLVTTHLSHRINKIKLSAHHKIDLRGTLAYAWGFAKDENQYVGIQDLRYGLLETGMEIYNLYSGLGLGVYYRWGDYSYDKKIENLTLRITFVPLSWFK